jgi:DNA binding protein with HTH domain
MLKEVRLRFTGGCPSHPAFRLVYESATLESFHDVNVLAEVISSVNVVTGAPAEVDEFILSLGDAPAPPHILETRLVEQTARRAVWYTRWGRPRAGEGYSPEHIVLDHLGSGALIRYRVRPGEIQARIASERATDLEACVEAIEATVSERYTVRRTYAGDYRVDDEPASALGHEDAVLLRTALRLGYYDAPRRATLAEVAGSVARSKSTVSERLKALEADAIEALLARSPLRDAPVLPAATPAEGAALDEAGK